MDKNDVFRKTYTSLCDSYYRTDGFEEFDRISETSIDEIFDYVVNNREVLKEIKPDNIPQFSNREDVFKVISIILDALETITSWKEIGYYLCPKGSKEAAKTKYGENHYKLAVQLGLAIKGKIAVTKLGIALNLQTDRIDKNEFIAKLSLGIPIIQRTLVEATERRINMTEVMGRYLSASTVVRRRSNIRNLLANINSYTRGSMLENAIMNITWNDTED